jgi:MerR family transcriptional regulator, light-induced transcriptional regulator
MTNLSKLTLEIPADAPFAPLTTDYVVALLNADRYLASQMIVDKVANSEDVKAIYLNVFQTSLREIGRLWQTGQISVAQEHYCTAATQMIMSQLYPYIFTTEKNGLSLVATCVSGELHEVGIRMIADFFEIGGWDTYYLGANTPAKSLLTTIEEQEASILAISASMFYNVDAVAELISHVRTSKLTRDVTILVGGYPFLISPDLWKQVGADGFAKDAEEALALGNRSLESHSFLNSHKNERRTR